MESSSSLSLTLVSGSDALLFRSKDLPRPGELLSSSALMVEVGTLHWGRTLDADISRPSSGHVML